MTVYFLSRTPAALRLDGAYAGIIDDIPRRIEAEEGAEIFVEAVPSDDRLPVNFMFGAKFLAAPPSCCAVYRAGGDVAVEFVRYEHKRTDLAPICQTRFCGNLVTLCRMGGIMLCVDRPDGSYALSELGERFSGAMFSEAAVAGMPVLCIAASGALAILSERGEVVFCNAVKSYSLGNMLGVTVAFDSCAGIVGECNYGYDGAKFTLVSGRSAETRPVAEEVMKYAMTLCSATHPDSECATEAAKKYVRLGASPRAGQALISAAKVRALMHGRFNVAYSDLNALAYPVLRHRMKMNFEAIAERVTPDDVITMIIAEVSKKFGISVKKPAGEKIETQPAAANAEENTEAPAQPEEKKRRLFGKK